MELSSSSLFVVLSLGRAVSVASVGVFASNVDRQQLGMYAGSHQRLDRDLVEGETVGPTGRLGVVVGEGGGVDIEDVEEVVEEWGVVLETLSMGVVVITLLHDYYILMSIE